MNLKNLKKVHEDEHVALFRSKEGHEVRVSKKGLSDKFKKGLSELPLHASEGADTADVAPEQLSPESQVIAQEQAQIAPENIATGNTPTAPGSQTGLGAVSLPQPQQPPPPALPAPQQPAPEQQPVTPQSAQVQRQQAAQQYNMDHAAEMGVQDAKYAQDLSNGHIQPMTYKDLFANKSTVGKIGTIFGLLLSGAGSGLSHQPNAALEMMKQEINNDLEAQKQSKGNAQNFYKLNQQNEMNKASILRLKQEGKLTEAQAQSAMSDIMLKADNHAKNQMELSMLHDLQGNVDKLPPGQTRAQQQAALDHVKTAAAGERIQRNAQTANALNTSQQAYEQRTNKMRHLGIINPAWDSQAKDRESKEVPGVGYSNTSIPQESKERIKKIKEFGSLLNEYESLGNKVGWRGRVHALSPSEKARATSIRNDLISSYNDVKGLTRFTGNEEELYKNIVPNIGSMNLTGSQLDLLHRLRGSIGQKYDQELTSSGIQPFSDAKQIAPPTSAHSVGEGTTGTYQGRKVVYKNGKWGYM